MKLFISYARVDQPYCIQIVNKLEAMHDVWFDKRMVGGSNWWKKILHHLEQADGFVYLLSPDSVESDYCLQELQIALEADKYIIPVLITPDTVPPESIQHIHYIDLTPGLTADTITDLFGAVKAAEQELKERDPSEPPRTPKQESLEPPVVRRGRVIEMAVKEVDAGRLERGLILLKQAKFNGEVSAFVDLDRLIEEIEERIRQIAMERDAERDYIQILMLVQSETTRNIGLDAFAKFQKRFPDYDPHNIAGRYTYTTNRNENIPPPFRPAKIQVPRINMVDIPEGPARLEELAEQKYGADDSLVTVPTFRIGRYPITHEQFSYFLKSPDGYCDERWWVYSRKARAWWQSNPAHPKNQFRYKHAPRETVSWYSAVAFTQWLSHHAQTRYLLPRLLQWQRAVQGDDNRSFPWGNNFDLDRCNTRETNLRQTSAVNENPRGASPYKVLDLAGNIWEWSMDYLEDEDILQGRRIRKRAVVGGSYKSPLNRAQVGFHYFLHPSTVYGNIGFRIVELID